MKRLSFSLLLALCFFFLGSCALQGGGAGEPAPTASPEAQTPVPEPEPSAAPTPAPTAAPTPEPDAAELRLAAMTREEKLCQMLLLCSSDEEKIRTAAEQGVGGLCLYAASFNGKSRDEVAAMTADLQARAAIPLLLAVDEEGGYVCRVSYNPRLRAIPFASPRTLYQQGGWPKIESDTEEKARLLLDLGLNVNLAPVADVPQTWTNYIYVRCFSTVPEETADYVDLVVRIMKREGIGSTLKHFPGYGGSADTHTGQAYDERPYEAFAEGDFLPFAAGIAAGADAVLVSHNIVLCMDADHPASLSPEVHRILREELGFDGVILCDDLSMEAIAQFADGEEAAVLAAQAGNDLLCCGDREGVLRALQAALEDGRLSEEQVDRSVLRILRWKLSLGLTV